MAGIRARKNGLIFALKAKAMAHHLDPEVTAKFESMYRSARTQPEQDQVTRALDEQIHGWKTGTDAYSRLLQAESGIDALSDDDPPSLTAHLARCQVTFIHK
jgi:hypothetical protein